MQFIADPPDGGIHKEQKQEQDADIIVDLYGGVHNAHNKANLHPNEYRRLYISVALL